MAGLEALKKKLKPLFDAEEGLNVRTPMDPSESYMVSDGGTINLLSRSFGVYNINELGLQKHAAAGTSYEMDTKKIYHCASHEMHVFGCVGCGASSVVHKAIHIPNHQVMALKKINVFEKEKRQQLLNEIRTLCESSCFPGLVEFYGAFYSPDTGQICIALEYMDGGSFADILRMRRCIPEPVLSCMLQKLLNALSYLHRVRHLVHRDIKPANLLVNLHGVPKITDFGISAGLQDSMAMCATFVGTVTYMSPERIQNESYSYPADIWSLGLSIFECGTGDFPYTANEGPANLMLQVLSGEQCIPDALQENILYDPSPTPSRDSFSPEFCSFVEACLQKDPNARPTAEQLQSHPFIKKYENVHADLEAYVHDVFDPTQRLKDMADMLTVHYYILFDGSDGLWHHIKNFYNETSTFSVSGKHYKGQDDIFQTLSELRRKLAGNRHDDKLVHIVEKLHCRLEGKDRIAIRASGSFIIGQHFLICGTGAEVEGMPSFRDVSPDLDSKRVGTFYEQFILEPGKAIGSFCIVKQELYILQQ